MDYCSLCYQWSLNCSNNQEVIFELDEEEVVTIIIVALIKSVDIVSQLFNHFI